MQFAIVQSLKSMYSYDVPEMNNITVTHIVKFSQFCQQKLSHQLFVGKKLPQITNTFLSTTSK